MSVGLAARTVAKRRRAFGRLEGAEMAELRRLRSRGTGVERLAIEEYFLGMSA